MTSGTFRQPRQPLVEPNAIDWHIADMTATIGAQMSLSATQQRLGESNQWIPIDGDGNAPIGQLVEQNSTGPLRLGFGAWRDLLLGCQFRIANGQLITVGGRTVKNVAGYDLTKFAIGQRGQFASIVTITTRTYKRPDGALLAELEPSDRFIGQVMTTPLRPSWAVLGPDSLLCGWVDDEPALAMFERLIVEHKPKRVQRRSLSDDMAHRAKLWKFERNMFKASVQPVRVMEFARLAGVSRWAADPAFGIVIGPLEQANAAALREAAQAVGGSVVLIVDDHIQWHGDQAEQRLLRELQKAFEAPP